MDDAIELDPRGMKVKLPNHRDRHWKDAIKDLLDAANTECVDLDCGDWFLTYTDLQDLMVHVDQSGRRLDSLISNVPATVVSARAFGVEARLQQSESFGSRELISQQLPSESTPTQPTRESSATSSAAGAPDDDAQRRGRSRGAEFRRDPDRDE